MRIALGLVHYPILDARGNIVATNITNLDLHDIARACRVYGIERYYLIHPMEEQLMFVSRILEHWRIGEGAQYNPMRKTALTMVHTAPSLEAAIADWKGEKGPEPALVATHARLVEGAQGIRFRELREKIEAARDVTGSDQSLFLLFGTGYGLTPETMTKCTYLLEPIRGASKDDYRHLSVRSAVSICLDRLLGPW
jgi:hypothetical protein